MVARVCTDAAACFGGARTLSFAHPEIGNTIGFKLEDGDAYAFGPAVNRALLHGVPKTLSTAAQDETQERLSVVIWGRRQTHT